jgi:hypothetical protein
MGTMLAVGKSEARCTCQECVWAKERLLFYRATVARNSRFETKTMQRQIADLLATLRSHSPETGANA